MFILVFASFSAWCLYEFYKWQQQMNMVNRFMDGRLPGMLVN